MTYGAGIGEKRFSNEALSLPQINCRVVFRFFIIIFGWEKTYVFVRFEAYLQYACKKRSGQHVLVAKWMSKVCNAS